MIKIIQKRTSSDSSVKYLFQTQDNLFFESIIFIREKQNGCKYTMCVSSQVGCKMQCAFCATSYLGYKKNLTDQEMLECVKLVMKDTGLSASDFSYVALMGMGEPLDNYQNIICFIENVHKIGLQKVSLSTVGIPQKIVELSSIEYPPELFISLHFVTEDMRKKYMPAARKISISEIDEACKYYYSVTQNKNCGKVKLSYMLMSGINDSIEDAEILCRRFDSSIYKINLLSYNQHQYADFVSPSQEQINAFVQKIHSNGFDIEYRRSLGSDIAGGCGQMVGKYITRGE